MSDLQAFPQDWQRALVMVAHPDDPEYGMAAAVAQWVGGRKGRQLPAGLPRRSRHRHHGPGESAARCAPRNNATPAGRWVLTI